MPTKTLFIAVILLASLMSFKEYSIQTCEYGKNDCGEGFVCLNWDTGKTKCQRTFPGPYLSVEFPFFSSEQIICDQGNLSPAGNSHTWWNTAYALDLNTKKRETNDKAIKAGARGRIISYNECRGHNDNCGTGFGNHVKILTDDGFILLYAHLEHVNVNTGDQVTNGQVIGFEGMTGSTGQNNPHLHFSVHYDWRDEAFDFWREVGVLPASVPFYLRICQRKYEKDCATTEIFSTDIKCLRANNDNPTIW